MKSVSFFYILFCVSISVVSQNALVKPNVSRHHVSSFSPASPYAFDYTQPDGSVVSLIIKGDGLLNRTYTVDGFVVEMTSNGAFYCLVNENEEFVKSAYLAHNKSDRSPVEMNLLKDELQFPSFSSELKTLKSKKKESLQNPNLKNSRTTGLYHTLILLVDFPDKPAIKSLGEFQNYAMQPDYNNTGSIRDYYLENSFGQMDLQIDVFGWYRASQNWAYYGGDDSGGDDSNPRELAREACEAAEAAGVDFSKYDNDGDGYVDGIQIIHAGGGEEAGAGTDAIWSHSWWMSSFNYDGVELSAYTMNPELYGAATTITSIGVVCHEFGHNLGLPDFYDTDYSSDGLGDWDLMSGGSWNNNGKTPACHNAWSKNYLGWHTPTEIDTAGVYILANANENNISYKVTTKTNNEYFLLENRQRVGFDSYLPGKGLLIFHVDGTYINSTIGSNTVNNTDNHYGLDIEEADGSAGSYSGDAFPGSSNKTSFTDGTNPSSKSWAGVNTIKPITNIKENTVDKTITFDFMGGNSLLPMADFTASKTTVYPGQSVNFSDASYNNPVSWQWFFDGATPSTSSSQNPTGIVYGNIGTYRVKLIVTNAHGADTIEKNALIKVTNMYLMEASTIYACDGRFYDQGGIGGSYPNSKMMTMTFLPSSPDSVLEFDFYNFTLESSTDCASDYFEVYDGINNSATKIGRFCGTSGPGIVRATNSAGALTFKFKSNSTTNANGWIARIKCVSPNGISEANKNKIMVYPNPSQNEIHIKFEDVNKKIIQLFSIDGRLMKNLQTSESEMLLDVSDFSNGVYFLKFSQDNHQSIQRVIIQK